MATLPRLVFVGHSYHEKTGSTVFMRELLAAHFELTTLWDRSWLPGEPGVKAAEINATGPDAIVFFQQLPSRRELRRIRCTNLTWIPMHDGVDYGSRLWRKLNGAAIKVLNFSQRTHRFFLGQSYDSLAVQYYPEPRLLDSIKGSQLDIFFWVRQEQIGWHTLKALLGTERPRRVVMRFSPDPGQSPARPDAVDIRDYRIELHEGWMEHSRYLELLRGCTVFLAPRVLEGIGMAALEAMSGGMVVAAADRPTMNEYIRHGVTGFLFDPQQPGPLDFAAHLPGMSERLLQDIAVGRERWLAAQPRVLDFVRQPSSRLPSLVWRVRRTLGR